MQQMKAGQQEAEEESYIQEGKALGGSGVLRVQVVSCECTNGCAGV